MHNGLEALLNASAAGRDLYRPEILRPSLPADRERLRNLLERTPGLQVHDELLSQLRELVRTLNPTVRYSRPELEVAAHAHLMGTAAFAYGVWAYYPWNARLVHLLDETEFALVRTDRNRNKITTDEQKRLSGLKVGVVGLSVGQSICLTMALERSFGELRIADHDTLELSNLNRIRSGLHSMGNLKTVNVAREIAELDPYLKVTLFNEGVTRDNIDRFFTEGGALDVVVDECDSVDVKILLRQKARSLRIPVVMDTSDRGMLDVERFDLEPDRPILHGLIDHLNIEDAAKAKTNEEKLPFVLPIAGLDTLSKRMKASMLEIESTTVTWPQLATSVVLGGALGADITRRIGLDQSSVSGRWYVDVDEIIAEPRKPGAANVSQLPTPPPSLTVQRMIQVADAVHVSTASSFSIDEQQATALVEAACAAPSGGNNQPWRFLLHRGELLVFMDPARAFSTIDPGRIYARLGIGAALENLLLRASELGLDLHVIPSDHASAPELIATIVLHGVGAPSPEPLASFIGMRCTNRRKGDGLPIEPAVLHGLRAAVEERVPEASVTSYTDPEVIARIGALCGQAERVRMLNPISHWDMFQREMRWTPESARTTGDGVDVATLELSLSDRTGISVAADAGAIAHLREWNAGRGMERLSKRLIAASPAVVVISLPQLTDALALRGGQAVERFWLQATRVGLSVHPIAAPIYMGVHQRFDRTGMYSAREREELSRIHAELISTLGDVKGEPFFMLRLDHADAPTARSLRKPIAELFHIHQPAHA